MNNTLLATILLGMAVPATATAQVGVVAEPCAALPPAPPAIASYLARMAAAKASGERLPPPSAEGLAAYAAWQQQLLLADPAGLCRYRAANTTLGKAGPDRVVFLGNSITENWPREHAAFFAPDKARGDRVGRGISGQTSLQMLGRFQADVVALQPAVVHILAGTNDIAGNGGPTSIAAITDNLRAMVELARANGIRVALGTVPPARAFNWRPEVRPVAAITALNQWIRTYAIQQKLALADYHAALDDGAGGIALEYAEDGVHPTAAGYALMEKLAEQALAEARRQPRYRLSR